MIAPMPGEALIASDASAKGGHAAFGGVVVLPDGTRVEVNGPLPRSDHQEVTAALAVLQYLPAGMPAVLQVDAQDDVLRASLVITHPQVSVTRIPRNSSDLHERAHELARGALKALIGHRPPPSSEEPRVAVFEVQGVETTAPRYAVAYWHGGEVETQTGTIRRQQTKALTLRMLQEQAAAAAPTGYTVLETRFATPRHTTDAWQATHTQLSALRRACTAALHNPPAP